MAKPLSTDLRDRLIDAVTAGASGHAAAARFRVVPSTVSKLMKRFREAGTSEPRPQGGDRRSGAIEVHANEIVALIEARVDITLAEIAAHIETHHGRRFAPSVIWRCLDRRGLTFKKNRTRQ
jgi:transposase